MLLLLIMFAYAGDTPPMVNEAHYLAKAKNFWDPQWCAGDLFVSSAKAHTTFYAFFGCPTQWVSLSTTAWLGRIVGWALIATGLQQLCRRVLQRRGFSLVVLLVWIAGIENGNLAGEWVIGGIEAKVPAYGLILLGLSAMVARRWNQVWIYLGGASAFHVLSGGWSVVAAMFVWLCTEMKSGDRKRFFSWGLLAGGAIALLGLVPALALTFGATHADSTAAAKIYTYYRIKHHLLPADFQTAWYIRHALLVAIAVLLAVPFWRRPAGDTQIDSESRRKLRSLAFFALGAVVLALIGLLIGLLPPYAPDLAARLLRFYWFRLTDAAVPLFVAVAVAAWIVDRAIWKKSIGIALVLIAAVLMGISMNDRMRLGVPPSVSNDLLGPQVGTPAAVQRAVMKDWLAVCRWARLSTLEDEVFLTPRHQQTFKWYAQRAEVVNWKDVPQDAQSLRQWYQRFLEIYPRYLGYVRVTIRYDKLREYRERWNVRYMIVDRRISGENLPLVKLYPNRGEQNATYAVYELPRP